eukprot:TRINITY_DN5917_c0_g1_i1.p1 TRINITY_DN5917_c0_g1~~TRINITY_DN5917_c0_g1_i1.p1  ORF type:complete len:2055 (+),score=809.41 TRINITY_DN5917_c0_g1_i1:120-6284(+)
MLRRSNSVLRFARFVNKEPQGGKEWRNRDAKALAVSTTDNTPVAHVRTKLAHIFALHAESVRVYDREGVEQEVVSKDGIYFVTGKHDPMKVQGSGWAHTDPEQTSTVSISQDFTGGGTVETDSMWGTLVQSAIERRTGRDRQEMEKLVRAFERYDLDNNMKLDLAELGNALEAMELRHDDSEVATIFLQLDKDRNGSVELTEWLDNMPLTLKTQILQRIDREDEELLQGPLSKVHHAAGEEGTEIEYHAEVMRQALDYRASVYQPRPRNVHPCRTQKEFPMDGNTAAAYVAYAMTETAFIYPISPATSMGELMDNWASQGRKNSFGQIPTVGMMQSEAGAAGAVHGCLATGALSTTFTASQGLLLMIPNLYLIAGELSPCVIHVSARTVAKHSLSIFNDHSDVMACRQTGFAMLCGSTVQEVMDMALVSHVATIKSRVPFMNFFDGWRTSAGIHKIQTIPYEDIRRMVPMDLLQQNLRSRALNPNHPIIRGVGQRPDIFFQNTQAAEPFYRACPGIVQETMDEVAQLTGRSYKTMEYYGHPDADRCVVVMGSAAETCRETVDYLNASGQKVGVLKVRLFRPWNSATLRNNIPATVRRIGVLDRTKEDGAHAPLYLDVAASYSEVGDTRIVVGGTFGLASKEFTPGQCIAVFNNLSAVSPMNRFTVGIHDDVTHTSLPFNEVSVTPKETTQCIFWGLGGDGTIGANKAAIKTLTMEAGLFGQAYFNYDSHKENGATTSHLRFGPKPIRSEYMICTDADYIACHHPSYVRKYDMLGPIKKGGTFVLNCVWDTPEDLDAALPPKVKREIAQNDVQFYVINATKMALDLGLGHRINTIMQAAFYKLSGVLPVDQALQLLKDSIVELYTKKGPKVVKANQDAVDATLSNLKKIEYPASWAETADEGKTLLGQKEKALFQHRNIPKPVHQQIDDFVNRMMDPMLELEGDKLPVSRMTPGGYMPTATCMHEKRGLAPEIPVWEPDKCTQCNYCAIVCPHAVIRPFLLDGQETKAAPAGYPSRKAQGGAEVGGLNFTIQLASMDCTGCAICVASCPDDALYMAPYEDVAEKQLPNWYYSINLKPRNPVGTQTVKGSQFTTPLLEFSGACPGCGETPYVKLLTQLYGNRLVIANASGCSSVWGGTASTNPYTVDEKGRGPAWGRSLFEDNAEYGFGMALATKQRRMALAQKVIEAVGEKSVASAPLAAAFQNWLKTQDDFDRCDPHAAQIERLLPAEKDKSPIHQQIYAEMDMLRPQSQWIIGGDGWAYDIGYNGVDHVLSRGENVNILVLDTEMYSNTGGQVSKSSNKSAVLKFAQKGKKELKKDLGRLAMQYENVYVASCAMGASYNQTLQAFREAESYKGTSLILAYSPCIDWGINMKYQMDSQKTAVESGLWKLYRYDPRLAEQGLPPLQLDTQKIKMAKIDNIFTDQNRFAQLRRKDAAVADEYQGLLKKSLKERHDIYVRQSMDDNDLLDYLKAQVGEQTGEKVLVLYASETGTAQNLAKEFGGELKRRGVRAKVLACDDYDFDALPNETSVVIYAATCGQGDVPENAHGFWKALSDPALPADYLSKTKFAVFAMGDRGYAKFNKVGKDFDEHLARIGGARICPVGLGDDKDDEKWETAYAEWEPDLCGQMQLPEPPAELGPSSFKTTVGAEGKPESEVIVPQGAKPLPMVVNEQRQPDRSYPRDIRHYEIDLGGTGVSYTTGDSMGVYPFNAESQVLEFLEWYGVDPNATLTIEDTQNSGKFSVHTTTPLQLLTQSLDLFGRPSRKFYKRLGMLATDPAEKEKLAHLMSKEGKEELLGLIKETVTHADVMKMFPSAKPPIEYLIEFLPPIKQRLYSIASAPAMDAERLHMCIVADDWETPKGKYQHGLCTGYLAGRAGHKPSPTEIMGKINPATFSLPTSPTQPILLVGLGTGIAPCRALIRDRIAQRDAGEEVGPISLYFGVRYKAREYTYGEEWDALHDNGKGILTNLYNAFSRDQKEKIYCQHRIAESSEQVYDYLVNKNGYYLLCGPGGPPVQACRKALEDSMVKHGGMTPQEAEDYVTQMQIEGRYNEEVW